MYFIGLLGRVNAALASVTAAVYSVRLEPSQKYICHEWEDTTSLLVNQTPDCMSHQWRTPFNTRWQPDCNLFYPAFMTALFPVKIITSRYLVRKFLLNTFSFATLRKARYNIWLLYLHEKWYSQTRTHMHIMTQTCGQTHAPPHTHTHAHHDTNMWTHTHTHTYTHKQSQSNTRDDACTRTITHTQFFPISETCCCWHYVAHLASVW